VGVEPTSSAPGERGGKCLIYELIPSQAESQVETSKREAEAHDM